MRFQSSPSSQPTAGWNAVSGMGQPLQSFPPDTQDDFSKLGVESQRTSSILAMILKVEQGSDSSLLDASEGRELTEVLDKAISSEHVNQGSKERFSGILCQICSSHKILPTSYSAVGVVSIERHALGSFADIYKGQRAGDPVRIKAFRTQTKDNMELIKGRLYREVVVWKYIKHPNLLPFIGILETQQLPFCIVGPWMPNGNIVEYTASDCNTNRISLLAQSACGLQYLHSLGIVHSNINPGNILITEKGSACLSDFGISGIITDPSVVPPGSTTTSKKVLVCYMAPEQIKPSLFDRPNSNPSKESDVHSLAMTAYEVLTGSRPYADRKGTGLIIKQITTGVRPLRTESPQLPDSVWGMMESCWIPDPLSRSTISQVYRTLSSSAEVSSPVVGNEETYSRRKDDILSPPLRKDKSSSQPLQGEKNTRQTPLPPITEVVAIPSQSATEASLQSPHPPDGWTQSQPEERASPSPSRSGGVKQTFKFKQAFEKFGRLIRAAPCW